LPEGDRSRPDTRPSHQPLKREGRGDAAREIAPSVVEGWPVESSSSHLFLIDYLSMADTLISPAIERRTNSALWYGLLITCIGIATHFLYFLRPPPTISHLLPWINLLLPAIGLILLFVGLAGAFGRSAVYSGKIWGSGVTAIALLLFAGEIWLFEKTRDVPKSAGAPQVGERLSEFTLSDSSGQPTSLSQLFLASADGSQPKAVLLIFYRGYW